MGSIAVFDKSFLQSLNLDESVWFDNFFNAVIVPYFYVETLADLGKSTSRYESVEKEVSIIAEKTPEMSSELNVDLCVQDLLGYKISLANKPIIRQGKSVLVDGKKAMNFDLSPEAEAFNRWMEGDFSTVESKFAKQWRKNVSNLDKLNIDYNSCKNLDDAFNIADDFINKSLNNFVIYDLLNFIVLSFTIPSPYISNITQLMCINFQYNGKDSLRNLYPYTSYLLKVEIFFQISIVRGFISKDRPSNKIDISYLNYIPFGMIFVSSDKLHRKTAPLFLKSNQEFIWGPDLKKGLKEINEFYSQLSEEDKAKGIMSFASRPPKDEKFLVSRLWAKYINFDFNESEKELLIDEIKNQELLKKLKKIQSASVLDNVHFDSEEVQSMNLSKSVRKRKGNWYLNCLKNYRDIKPLSSQQLQV